MMIAVSLHPAYAPSHTGICTPLKHAVEFNDSVCGQPMPLSDCTDAQTDLDFCCPNMREDTFFHGETQNEIKKCIDV